MAERFGRIVAALWLVLMSLVFYGFWNPALVLLLGASILFNYGIAEAMRRREGSETLQDRLLWFGIAANLLLLLFFKYAHWLLTGLVGLGLWRTGWVPTIALPLGISFYTFTQIGYLVDCRQKVTKYDSLLNYSLFVTFFPHLIAGPILHNGEIMPQFADSGRYRLTARNVAAGVTLFVIGLLKKSLIADSLAQVNSEGFAHVSHLQFFGAWGTLLGYSLQLYFDFSGYSDMALGLALMFNIRFPINFDSPYKARSIIDFWQRWHMTLTRYITMYIFSPIAMALTSRRIGKGLPMSKKALARPRPFASLVVVPTLITMGLAGIWHGAGLKYLVFGLIHGVYISVNHAWRTFGPKSAERGTLARMSIAASQVSLTYLAVLFALPFFRAASLADAASMEVGLLGGHGLEHPLSIPRFLQGLLGVPGSNLAIKGLIDFRLSHAQEIQVLTILVGFLIVWCLPNSQQIMADAEPALGNIRRAGGVLAWSASTGWAMVCGTAATIALLSIGGTHEFLYFQF